MPLAPMGNLSFESLYDDKLAKRDNETIFATAAPRNVVAGLPAESRFDQQKQVKMLHDYGYTPRQIAQTLNISLGEVDLILKLSD
jgi:hypothetical protein